MRVPVFLMLVSMAGVAAAVSVPGWSDLLLLAGPSAVASLILLLRVVLLMPGPAVRLPEREATPSRGKDSQRNPIIVDGSNVLFWKDNVPQIETLREVLRLLRARGFSPGVVFDANAGYLVAGRYLDDADIGMMIGLPADRVVVVPKGTIADLTVLAAARDLGARVVTNDRYRDWAEQHPEVREPGHLVRGGYRDGQVWLGLDGAVGRGAAALETAAE